MSRFLQIQIKLFSFHWLGFSTLQVEFLNIEYISNTATCDRSLFFFQRQPLDNPLWAGGKYRLQLFFINVI